MLILSAKDSDDDIAAELAAGAVALRLREDDQVPAHRHRVHDGVLHQPAARRQRLPARLEHPRPAQAAADDNAGLDPRPGDLLDLAGDLADHDAVNAKAPGSGKNLAGQFEEDPFVNRFQHSMLQ